MAVLTCNALVDGCESGGREEVGLSSWNAARLCGLERTRGRVGRDERLLSALEGDQVSVERI